MKLKKVEVTDASERLRAMIQKSKDRIKTDRSGVSYAKDRTPPQERIITNYEVGNDILHNICDKMCELQNEIRKTHPLVADVLQKNRLMLGPLVNILMEGSLAPTSSSDGKIKKTLSQLINTARRSHD